MDLRIFLFNNNYGPKEIWKVGNEKTPTTMQFIVTECEDGGELEVWVDGLKTCSFLNTNESN